MHSLNLSSLVNHELVVNLPQLFRLVKRVHQLGVVLTQVSQLLLQNVVSLLGLDRCDFVVLPVQLLPDHLLSRVRVNWVGFIRELLVRSNQLVRRNLPNWLENGIPYSRQVVDGVVEVVRHALRHVLDGIWAR